MLVKRALGLSLLALLLARVAWAGTVRVTSPAELRLALRSAAAGTSILVAPGQYDGLFSASGLNGTAAAPILLAAEDPAHPPVLRGGNECLFLSRVSHVVIRGLVLVGATGNGLNLDDGGDVTAPSHHVVLEGLVVRDIGPQGNRDGLKLSGVDDFLIRGCTIERWGDGGSGMDLVGCHRGLIADCTLRHRKGSGASGIQAKGGSSDLLIYRCGFDHAGERAVNLGGGTGLPFFRPPKPGYEARRLFVVGNTFVGSTAPLAFVGSEGCEASYNTLYRPARWVFRILQESRGSDFVPCRNGAFRRNLVVWRQGDLYAFVNVGSGTEPATFAIEENWWYCGDAPFKSRPGLPVAERNGVAGRDPGLTVDGLTIRASAAPGHGAHAKRAAEAFAALAPKLVPWAYEKARETTRKGAAESP
jgi:hypothetical protein